MRWRCPSAWLAIVAICTWACAGRDSPSARSAARSSSGPDDLAVRIARTTQRFAGSEREARVQLDADTLTIAPSRIVAIASERHAAGVELRSLDLSVVPPRLCSVRSVTPPRVDLSAEPGPVETACRTLEPDGARALFARVRSAATARVTLVAPPSAADTIRLDAIETTSSSPWLSIALLDAADTAKVRSFDAYLTSETAADYAPAFEAWSELANTPLQLEPRVDPVLAVIVASSWIDASRWPDWGRQKMLALAAALPSQHLIPVLLAQLDRDPETATLAVNALAAASNEDLRRDSNGSTRPLADVVADYRKALSSHATSD